MHCSSSACCSSLARYFRRGPCVCWGVWSQCGQKGLLLRFLGSLRRRAPATAVFSGSWASPADTVCRGTSAYGPVRLRRQGGRYRLGQRQRTCGLGTGPVAWGIGLAAWGIGPVAWALDLSPGDTSCPAALLRATGATRCRSNRNRPRSACNRRAGNAAIDNPNPNAGHGGEHRRDDQTEPSRREEADARDQSPLDGFLGSHIVIFLMFWLSFPQAVFFRESALYIAPFEPLRSPLVLAFPRWRDVKLPVVRNRELVPFLRTLLETGVILLEIHIGASMVGSLATAALGWNSSLAGSPVQSARVDWRRPAAPASAGQ